MQQLDIEDKEVKRLMQEFVKEMAEGSVVQHDVENMLAVVITDAEEEEVGDEDTGTEVNGETGEN